MSNSHNDSPEGRGRKLAFAISALALCIACIPYASRYYNIYKSQIYEQPIQVLPLQLIASPEEYNGAFVSFLGWCVVGFEHTAIQVSSDAARWNDAIWLDLNEDQFASVSVSEPKFCRVKGTFRSGWSGHMGRWPGNVSPVKDIVVYDESPKE